jgi:hypothetical protein
MGRLIKIFVYDKRTFRSKAHRIVSGEDLRSLALRCCEYCRRKNKSLGGMWPESNGVASNRDVTVLKITQRAIKATQI